MLECALVLGELTTLVDHVSGLDVAEALAAFDAVGQVTGDEREAAIVKLQAMARAGQFAIRESTDAGR